MRSAVLFVSLLLLSCIPLTTDVSAMDEDSGLEISVTFDDQTEVASVEITAPETTNVTLLDELKNTNLAVLRVYISLTYNQLDEIVWLPELIETVETGIRVCEASDLNSECSQSNIQFEHYPIASNYSSFEYWLIEESDLGNSLFSLMGSSSILAYSRNVTQTISPPVAIENLSAEYIDGVTTLSWDYPTGLDMNHSIMIYSHDSPATRENWNEMPKTIVSSNVAAGTTSYQIDHSGLSVEREIYYSVTLLYPTSEDTRFLGSNTLTSPVWEDNVAPLFIGELSATFDAETDTTTIDWEEGVQDDDLTINIYRSSIAPDTIRPDTLVAMVDAAQSTYQLEVPFGEHRQSWYAITLQDSQGNEIISLTESSPVSDPVIESTISTTTVSGINTERFADGTVVISWDDNTNNPNALAKVWRSISGPIDSLDDVEELGITNLSSEQFLHNPLDAQDEAWYAVTIVAAWGSEQNPWHDERLFSGINSLSQPLRETDEEVKEVVVNFTSSVMTTTGQRANLSDGSLITLGTMNEGDMIIISTSSTVSNISCQGIDGEGTSIFSQSDWALSFSANQSEEQCLGLIVDGDDEIGFILNWNYVETIIEDDDDDDDDDDDRDGHHDDDDDDDREGHKSRDGDGMETVATVILTIIILALLVYLMVMMRTPEYAEEE